MSNKKYIIKPTNKFKKCYAKLKKQANFEKTRAELEISAHFFFLFHYILI